MRSPFVIALFAASTAIAACVYPEVPVPGARRTNLDGAEVTTATDKTDPAPTKVDSKKSEPVDASADARSSDAGTGSDASADAGPDAKAKQFAPDDD